MTNLSNGKNIANTQSEIGLVEKLLVQFDQKEEFQRKTVKSYSKQI
jgi:hypothetical protein